MQDDEFGRSLVAVAGYGVVALNPLPPPRRRGLVREADLTQHGNEHLFMQ